MPISDAAAVAMARLRRPEGGGAMAAETDPILELSRCLEGITYPQSRGGLLDYARSRGAPEGVLDLLHQFPDWEFATHQQVMQALSEVRLREQ